MGIRTGKQFIDSLRDDRTIYVNGERVKDVTEYPQFGGIVATLASLYDLQHEHRDEMTFASPKTGERVAASFILAETLEAAEFRAHAEELRADHTLGLMGRMPDFCNAMVTDFMAARSHLGRKEPRYAENLARYYDVVLVSAFVVGIILRFPEAWVVAFESVSSAVTLAMVFVIQHTQHRSQQATQLKLDELIRSLPQADDRVVRVEASSEAEIGELEQRVVEHHRAQRVDEDVVTP